MPFALWFERELDRFRRIGMVIIDLNVGPSLKKRIKKFTRCGLHASMFESKKLNRTASCTG